MVVEIFTDGACRGNPGPGGWGVLLKYNEIIKTLYGYETYTTNNRMELLAAIKGIELLKRSCTINLFTDSQYLCKGMSEWLKNWKKRNWLTAKKMPIKNIDLWKNLDELAMKHAISWHWIKGHSGHYENDFVDALANKAIDEMVNIKE